ncbi:MAG: GIY-YIG nuclease family protein [Planctomycetota bacterium]|nr:GIY-YIG nuclease family protein [Planctomycetota bacterium]
MLRIAQRTAFDGFGPTSLGLRLRLCATGITPQNSHRETRRLIRRDCPARPGVYGMLNREGHLVYVGKAKSLRNRLISYFQTTADQQKAGRIVDDTARIVWETLPHELAALMRELELIRRWLPRFNVQGLPGRRARAYISIGRAPAPYVYLSPEPPARGATCFGPLRGFNRLSEAVRHVNVQFRLRDCPSRVPMLFSDQPSLFSLEQSAACPRFDLGTCLAPCAGECSQSQYAAQLGQAREFLEGSDTVLLTRLEATMAEAAAKRQFERAAMIRDIWQSIDWLHRSLDRLRQARQNYSFIYPVPLPRRGMFWFLFRRGQLVTGAAAPRNEQTAHRWLMRIDSTAPQTPVAAGIDPTKPATDEDQELLMLTAAWFRKYPDELARTIPLGEAGDRCHRFVS